MAFLAGWWRLGLWAPLLGLAAAAQSPGGAAHDYQIEAVFLFNFSQFVEWPPDALGASDEPFIIGILGADPFGGFLDATIQNEKSLGRSMVVRRYSRAEDASSSHILFIAGSEQHRFAADVAALKGRSILTVSDADDFLRQGGMIHFIRQDNRIRLQINLAAAKSAGLVISSKLLRPSKIFTPGKD